MGLSLSYPLVKEPESYDDPEYDEESEQIALALEIHEINLKYCYNMVQQRIRSFQEAAKIQSYTKDWNIMVQELQKTYPNWTSTDLLNLWHLFEQFDANGDRLLDFKEFNACIDLTMNSATPEQRKAMFTEADVHKYNCLNFEDFLQLMHNVRVGSPVPRTPEPEAEHDPDTQGIISDVSRMDTFQQMCYGLF